jgi:hypothetical protein
MSNSADPQFHREMEQQFIEHVRRLLDDDQLGATLEKRITAGDRGADLKRRMSAMGRPDRDLQNRMPVGHSLYVELSKKRFWLFRSKVGCICVECISPVDALLSDQAPDKLSKLELEKILSQTPPLPGLPLLHVLLSTSGFAADAKELAVSPSGRTVILVDPNEAGGFAVYGPDEFQEQKELLDPEAQSQKRERISVAIDQHAGELSGSGLAVDRLASLTKLPVQLVESELKSYARQNPGLQLKRLDGRMVLFREGTMARAPSRGADMPMIDRIRSLFARKGENDKKIAFLSERRAALGQQRDRAYEEMGSLEKKESDLRQEFKESPTELAKRRITSQLLGLRKEIQRRQQLMGVLNQQMNVVSTHLHTLELVQQGAAAQLPNSEEIASDAARAEEVLEKLEADSELAESIGGVTAAGISAEEQALYEELQRETGQPAIEREASAGREESARQPAAQRDVKPARASEKKASEPEAG